MRIISDWKAKFPRTCAFLAGDLPGLEQSNAGVWNAFRTTTGLSAPDAQAAVVDGNDGPLLWFLPLRLRTGGAFHPSVPGRISLSLDIAPQFEAKANDATAQAFMRLVTLHEMCHWAWHRQNRPDPDIAGEQFETAANAHPNYDWITAAAPAGAVASAVGNIAPMSNQPAATDGAAIAGRITQLKAALTPGGSAAPSPAFFDGSDVAAGMPRGIRNNNPGNIRVGENWVGLAERAQMTDFQVQEADFCVFSEPEWGLRAMARILQNYQTKHGLRTPHDIIARWAPASDNNDVTSYANAVASALGVATTAIVDMSDEATLIPFIKAVARHENGHRPPYADFQYTVAVRLL
jgi:hypothetical protein